MITKRSIDVTVMFLGPASWLRQPQIEDTASDDRGGRTVLDPRPCAFTTTGITAQAARTDNGSCYGAVALSDRRTCLGGGPVRVQIARASSVNAAATRNFGGTSMPSS